MTRGVFAGLAAVCLACGVSEHAAAQSFEGAITVRVPGGGRNASPLQEIEYLSRGGKVRLTIASPAGPVVLLGLPSEGKSYVVMESQRTYMELTAPKDSAGAAPQPALKAVRTGRKERIAGFECEHVLVEAASPSNAQRTDICVTNALGPFLNPSAGILGTRLSPWQRQLAENSGFPLKVTLADGTVALEVIKIEKRRISDAVFRIPADFSKMDMPRRP